MSRLQDILSEKKFTYTSSEQKKIRKELNVRSITGLIKLARDNNKFNESDSESVKKRKSLNYGAKLYNEKVKVKNQKIIKERKEKKEINDFKSRLSRDLRNNNSIKRKKLTKEKTTEMLKILNKTKGYFKLIQGDKIYTLNQDTLDRLLDKLDELFIDEIDEGDSDAQIVQFIKNNRTFEIKRINFKGGNNSNGGGFFKYTHKLEGVDLSVLQIYENVNHKNYTTNCFIHSMIESKLFTEQEINDMKTKMKTKFIRTKDIKKFCEVYKCSIEIETINDELKRSTRMKVGDKNSERTLKLGLIDNHYILKTKIPYTRFSIENWDKVKHFEDPHKVYRIQNGYGMKTDDRFIDSFTLVKLLMKEKDKYLTPITKCDEIYKTCYYDEVKEISNLNYSDNNVNFEVKQVKPKDKVPTIFFDTETIPYKKHKPFVMVMKYRDETNNIITKIFYGEECGLKMLFWISENVDYDKELGVKLIAHNLGYDFRFIGKYIKIKNLMERGTMLLGGECNFVMNKKKVGNLKIKLQDSYSLIPEKLSKFPDMFGLESVKEFIPYKLYTELNVKSEYIKLNKCLEECKKQSISNHIEDGKDTIEKDKELFMDNCKKWNCLDNDRVNIIKYAEEYCKIDVEVLLKGYEKFCKDIQIVSELDLNNYMTISQLSQDFYKNQGCYNGVSELSGIPREYIQKCMVGGRVMTRQNKKQFVKGRIQDFDAVSLYPSAMIRLGGLLCGSPKVLENKTYQFLEKCDGYFIQIKILKVNKEKNKSFPLMSRIDENGGRLWTNDMENHIMYVDKTTLEDLINFQGVEFEIIDGYYYDEGRNYKLKETTEHLFNERLKQKKDKNKIEKIYKLIMNSCYGKNLLKPIETESKFIIGEDNLDQQLIRNYNNHKQTKEYNFGDETNDYTTYKMDIIKPINEHFNYSPCGVEILSMSKRIMNEVMCLADENNIPIYYQDTDSLHIDEKNIEPLSKLYKNKYDRDLIGKMTGQFHSDFDSGICDEKSIHSKLFIGLGKKVYMDLLSDDKGNIDYHIRMKGVSGKSVKYHSKKDNIKIEELYEKLYNNETYGFDLACNGMNPCFEGKNDGSIHSKDEFYRIICFEPDVETKKRKIKVRKENLEKCKKNKIIL